MRWTIKILNYKGGPTKTVHYNDEWKFLCGIIFYLGKGYDLEVIDNESGQEDHLSHSN